MNIPSIEYHDYLRISDRTTGGKYYFAIINYCGSKRVSKKVHVRASDAVDYGQRLAARADRVFSDWRKDAA